MSDLSLLTGVYANVEVYGALIDKVIEQLRNKGSDPADPDQKKLAQLLVDASDQGLGSQSLEALVLDSLLRSSTGEPMANLKRLGERLLTRTEREAREAGAERLFVLTTQATHWFRERGFVEADHSILPGERQALYNFQRRSRVLVRAL